MAEYTTLFTEKYITDKLKLNELVIPNLENKLSVISRWVKENKDKTIYNKKEEQLQSDFLNDIFGEVLGYAYKRGLDIYNLEKEEKSKTDGTKPDGSLGYFTKDNMDTRVVIELKDAYTDLDHKQNRKNDNRTPVEQAFSYVSKCGGKCQWVIVSNFREIRLYPANDSSIYQKFMIEKLDDIIVLKQFYALLAKDLLFLEKDVSSTDSLLSLKIEGDANISKEFYAEYKKHRSILFNHIKENNPNIDENTILTKSQKILDRIIFICFCEDKGLIPHKTFRKILEQTKNNSFDRRKDKLWQTVKGLFDAIDKGYPEEHINQFNGGLFKPDEVIDNLVITDSVLADIISLESYDFDSDLNVNILGHIFEQSISDLEELKAIISGEEVDKKKGKRKKDGIFYTPEYITRYIVKEAVGGWLEDKRKELGFYDLPKIDDDMWVNIRMGKTKKNNQTVKAHLDFWLKYREALDNIKVLDPACGSGSFLVQVFDYLRQQRKEVNEEISTFEGIQTDLFNYDTHILSKNIYGVDLNAESVEITKLALWLKTANKNDKLTSLDNNIKCGNSLIDDKSVDTKAFNWNKEFKEIMDNGGFDVIVGNPPYIKEYENKTAFNGFREYSKYYIGKMDLWYAFVCIGLDILSTNGRLGFIALNNWITNSGAKILRNKVIEDSCIVELLDFNDYMVFEDASIQTMIMIFRKNSNDDNYNFLYRKIKESNIDDIYSLLSDKQNNHFDIMYPVITREKYKNKLLTFSYNEKLLNKICREAQHFDKKEIGQGIVIPQDFLDKNGENKLKSLYKQGTGVFALSEVEKDNLNLNKEELNLIKPYYSTEQIHRYYTDINNKNYIIYTDSKFKNKNSMDSYPNLKKHLDKFQQIITSDNKPYGLHRARKEHFFNGEKIIVLRKCADRPVFSYSDFPCYVSATFFIIQTNRCSMKYLTGLLNSTLIMYWLKNRGKLQGNNYQVDKEPLINIPLQFPHNVKQQSIIDLVDIMLSKNKELQELKNKFIWLLKGDFKDIEINNSIKSCFESDWGNFQKVFKKQKISLLGVLKDDWADRFNRYKTDINNIKSVIADTDKKIDTLVYQLYGLTDDEIKIIEESLKNEQKK